MQRIGVLSNRAKPGVVAMEKEILNWLRNRGATVLTPREVYQVTNSDFIRDYMAAIAGDCDGILVLGGDGTLLAVAGAAAYYGLPILGINMGRLGFLAELEPGERLFSSLDRLLAGDYYLENRMMLKVRVLREGRAIADYHCLNDGVVQRNYNVSGLLQYNVLIDDKPSISYHGDGVIIATPTGASGYSLSAAGPLVSPEMEAMVITPICAQSLYSRSLVVGADRVIGLVAAAEHGGCYLHIDGKTATMTLLPGDTIEFSRSPMVTQLVRLNGKTFFDVLNEKLRDRH